MKDVNADENKWGQGSISVDDLKWNEQGLIPAIVQDAISKDVLMLAYMNKESLRKSLTTGETWFWSRSRQALWHKGETSGHTQQIREIRYDCDADTLLVLVEPKGPACHTGQYSCFYRKLDGGQGLQDQQEASVASKELDESGGLNALKGSTGLKFERFAILGVLESLIAKREAERPEGAYTTYLFEQGVDKILKKVGEEAAEVIIAAKNRSADELRYEASDLIYHLLVLLREQKLPLDELMRELERRHVTKKK